MPITADNIIFRGSTVNGAAGNTTANEGPGSNLGRYINSNDLTSGQLSNVFPDVTGDENAANQVDYQCVFVRNSHANLTLQNAVVYISGDVAGGTDAAIGVDPTAPSDADSATAQAVTIPDRLTAPANVNFASPTTKAAGLSLGSIGPDQVRGIWVRRTAANRPAMNLDGVTLTVVGDTAA